MVPEPTFERHEMTREAHIARFTAQEALVCAMVLMSVADGPMSDAEVAMMSRMVQELPVFADFHSGEIETVTERWRSC